MVWNICRSICDLPELRSASLFQQKFILRMWTLRKKEFPEVKNIGWYRSTYTSPYVFLSWYLFKYSDNLSFFFWVVAPCRLVRRY
jgi:hypothetical protein